MKPNKTMNHPYVNFESTNLWFAIDDQIGALERNGDIKITTAREYVVGSLCKRITMKKLVLKKSTVKR